MATITPEMEALLNHAETNGLCMYLMYPDDDGDFSGWEDMLWEPHGLRQALLDFPEQARAGDAYPWHNYAGIDLQSHAVWRIVDPNELLARFLDNARAEREYAEYFKKVWVDRTELPNWKQKDGLDD
jgi:hypothetical protein